MGISDFVSAVQSGRITPQNPYSHSASLIDTDEEINPESSHKIVEKHEFLANISDDQFIRLYQNDAFLFSWLQNMAKRDPCFIEVYKTFYGAWRAELGLTRAKGGKEREYQANTGGNYQPDASKNTGFGAQLRQMMEQQQMQDAQLIGGLMKKK